MTHLKFEYIKNVNNPSSIHGIYPYRGKISAIDAKSLISQLPKKGVLLDPFCGSGTIIYEGRKHGLQVIGVDSNPIAVQISKAKLDIVDVKKSIDRMDSIIHKMDSSKTYHISPKASKYFHVDTAKQIAFLKQHYETFSDYEKAAFMGAICLAARGCNGYKWSSTQIGKVIENKIYIDFLEKFKMKLKKHAYPVNPDSSRIIEGDSRRLSEFIPQRYVNIVYTSPPYFDALDYTSNYSRIVHYIFENDLSSIKSHLIQKFDTYERDMKLCFEEIKKVTTDDAVIIFVVGNKKKGEKTINGGDFFTNIISEKPSYIVEREYSGTASKIWDKINKTERKEQIIVWEKSKW